MLFRSKQLEKLSSFAKTLAVKEHLLNLPIMTECDDIKYSWQLIDNMIQIQSKYHALPLTEEYDCLHILKLISKEHVMTLEEANDVFLSLDNQHQMYQFIESIVKASDHFQVIEDYKISNIEFLYKKFDIVFTDEGDFKSDATPVLARIRKQLKMIDKPFINDPTKLYLNFVDNIIIGMINSNFKYPHKIDRLKLYNLLL